MRRPAEGAVLDQYVRRRTVAGEFRIVVGPWPLSSLHDNAVVIDGDVDIADGEAAALVDVDGVGRRPLEFLPLRVLQHVGNNRAVVHDNVLAVVEMRRPEL